MRLDRERQRLLAERNRWYARFQPRLRLLRRRLLGLGGQEIVMQTEPYLDDLIDEGVTWRRVKPRRIRARMTYCHANVAETYQKHPTRYRIVTGWALHPHDDVWRKHSWLLRADELCETTAPAAIYHGAILSDWRAERFVHKTLHGPVQPDSYQLACVVGRLLDTQAPAPRRPR